MLINFTKKHQFATRVQLRGANAEQVTKAKILGLILSDDLSWDANCQAIIKKVNMRVQLLRKVASFGTDTETMKLIYIHIIRVVLEGLCQVWNGGLTSKNRRALERWQKMCLKVILPVLTYKEAMKRLNIEDLQKRRSKFTLKFAKLNSKEGKLSHLFEKNPAYGRHQLS